MIIKNTFNDSVKHYEEEITKKYILKNKDYSYEKCSMKCS